MSDRPSRLPAPGRRPAALAVTLALALGVGVVDAASAAPGVPQRIAGATRVETAVAASRAAFPQGAPAVVVVQADATPDGLTASYAAGVAGAPILYVARDAVPRATADEVVRLGARRAVVVGGGSVVGPGVVVALESAGITVARLAGADRYATAAAVALGSSAAAGVEAAAGAGVGAAPDAVLVANGDSPADALAAGPIAYRAHEPILLVRTGEVPAPTAAALAGLAPARRVVLGGTAVADDAVAAAVGATARLAGADRQGTAVAVAEHAVREQGFTPGAVALVGADDRAAADALVAAPLAGSTGTPLLFTAGATLGPAASAYLSATAAPGGTGYVLGGTSAVPQAVVDAARAAAGG